jgi:hypothetical protein
MLRFRAGTLFLTIGHYVDVSRLACRISAAMNSTPDSINPEMKWTLRANRSNFAIRRVTLSRLDSAIAPVWGPNSFNDGAGMNSVTKMAAFVFHSMPPNHPGTLSAQDAYDVSAYIHSQPRPKFNQAYKNY